MKTMRWMMVAILAAMAWSLMPAGSGGSGVMAEETADKGKIVVYCGRGEALVGPLLKEFEKQTGIKVEVSFATTGQQLAKLQGEGERSPADLFWSQEEGALGVLARGGKLADLPKELLEKVDVKFRNKGGQFVATSGRARVLAYSTTRVKKDDLPKSVFDLADPKYKDKIGWAPPNASFQAFVTALRKTHGEEKAKKWLQDVKANGAKTFANNRLILDAIAAGQIDVGLPNHYYLIAYKQKDSAYPVDQTFFADGDVGNLMMLAGAGVLKTARNKEQAHQLIKFLLDKTAQTHFTEKNNEYPVVPGVKVNPILVSHDELTRKAPKIELDQLDDLEGTKKLLKEVGL